MRTKVSQFLLKKLKIRINRWGTEDFKRRETAQYDTVTMDLCYYTFVQTHRVYNTKSEL